jgi:hypothetical protein
MRVGGPDQLAQPRYIGRRRPPERDAAQLAHPITDRDSLGVNAVGARVPEVAGVLLSAEQHHHQHRPQHRDVLNGELGVGVFDKAGQSRTTAATLGANIAAALFDAGLQPWPRWRIQATIGTVLETAMPSSKSSGASLSQLETCTPTMLSSPAPAPPSTSMPRNIATTISP